MIVGGLSENIFGAMPFLGLRCIDHVPIFISSISSFPSSQKDRSSREVAKVADYDGRLFQEQFQNSLFIGEVLLSDDALLLFVYFVALAKSTLS